MSDKTSVIHWMVGEAKIKWVVNCNNHWREMSLDYELDKKLDCWISVLSC